MTQEEKQKWMQINTDDFNTMRSMLSEIEMKIMQVDPRKQVEFYSFLKRAIFEAWQDACNPNDSFLFGTPLNPSNND